MGDTISTEDKKNFEEKLNFVEVAKDPHLENV